MALERFAKGEMPKAPLPNLGETVWIDLYCFFRVDGQTSMVEARQDLIMRFQLVMGGLKGRKEKYFMGVFQLVNLTNFRSAARKLGCYS